MSTLEASGKIVKTIIESDAEVEYTWKFKIDKIKELVEGKTKYLQSPKFYSSSEASWLVFLQENKEFIGLYVQLISGGTRIATCNMTFHSKTGKNYESKFNIFQNISVGQNISVKKILRRISIILEAV